MRKIAVAGIVLTGVLGTAAPLVGPPIVADQIMQQVNNESHDTTNLEAQMNDVISKDPKFVAIIPKLVLTERYTAVNTAGLMQEEINRAPWPQAYIYNMLPGFQESMNHMRDYDAMQQRIVNNKTHAKLDALFEARDICAVVKNSTPTHLPASAQKIELDNPENLSAYLEYCGGDAASFKSILSTVVVKRDYATEAAQIEAQVKAYDEQK